MGNLQNFVNGKGATTIAPLPSPGPDQRGPTCGFYALGFVLQYWYERQQQTGVNQNLARPLPVRTSQTPSPAQKGIFEKGAKSFKAWQGEYSSLRHYGKYNKLTAYGSVFNAENLVKIAQGKGAQYAGQYDGRVLITTSKANLIASVRRFLTQECPVIIPFDVGDDGDPGTQWTGERAHWAVLVGFYTESGTHYWIHYHWGKYRYATALDFAVSNDNLTSNKIVPFQKVEIKAPDGRVVRRDYMGPSFSSQVPGLTTRGYRVSNLGGPKRNVEFNNPGLMRPDNWQARHELQSHGFDPDSLGNGGLVKKLVAVYPQSLHTTFATL